ncbi:alpha/beta hydrolase [Deinococcus roseus]|uniref:Phospholipase/carboxylesterase n=1 Tax=Deinococcus roseus TaxID=392414 RepID=A0ABQ2CZL2_9DEIO|nr:dienelactone hydrolase family protein [Deinococcus roseus]GGJ30158.1 phospholipase/carboxylesterase [Deinococcus roseus]
MMWTDLFSPSRASKTAEKGVVLLHGRSKSARSILPLAHELGLQEHLLVTPEATTGSEGSWYPYSTLAPRSMNEPWLSESLEKVHGTVEDLLKERPAEQLILAGFAQGACLALEYALRNPRPYAAVLSLHGVLMDHQHLNPNPSTLFYFCSSENDPLIPAWKVRESHETLCLRGAKSKLRLYAGMHDAIPPEELVHIQAALGLD